MVAFYNLFSGVQNSVYMLLAIALHEIAHLLTILFLRLKTKLIRISALGMEIILPESAEPSPKQNIIISLSGPLLNIILGLLLLFIMPSDFCYINLVIGCINLLPVMPLDGGRTLLYAFMLKYTAEKSERYSFIISLLVLFPLAVLGFAVLIYSKNNFSLLLIALYLFVYLLTGKNDSPISLE